MRKLKFLAGVVFLLLVNFCYSHEHWIDLENFQPVVGEKIKVFACSGHSFPKSNEILGERVFDGLRVITPDNKEIVYETKPDKDLNARVSEVIFEKEGTYIVLFLLKKPPLKTPSYIAKSLVTVGAGKGLTYRLGSGLEIVPEKEISKLKIGEELLLNIFYDNKPVDLTASISINGKKNFFLKTDKGGRLVLKLKSSGKYLITTSYKGTGTSLTFYIAEGTK
jgi:uncharacterized GH25 family protein